MNKFLDSLKFIRNFVKSPQNTGTLCPSSKFLGRKMAYHVKDNFNDVVVELGAGTGAITHELLIAGMNPKKLYCIEFDQTLCNTLKQRFPQCNIINGSAENILEIIGDDKINLKAVVSSLPLLSLPKELVDKILTNVQIALPTNGKFVQFTYNLNRNIAGRWLTSMNHSKRSNVYLNIPPARVDVYEKF